MPDKKGRQTPQEAAWIDHMARTGDPVYAASKAGYAAPYTSAGQLQKRPEIMADVRARMLRVATANGVAILERLVEITLAPTSKASDAIAAAKVLLPLAMGTDAERKAPHEMSGDELQRAIDQLRREASERAHKIEVIDGTATISEGPAPSAATTNVLFD